MVEIRDMPKLESPFMRKMVGDAYLVTPEITTGYEWVFEDTGVLATEKLNGTNISVVLEKGIITTVWNRKNKVELITGDWRVTEGLLESAKREFLKLPDGQHFGELIGPNVNGNPYKLERHLWVPLETYAREHLAYTSWGKYPKTFEAISQWLEKDIFSLFIRRRTGEKAFPEGVVFLQPSTGRMAKLRRDMYPWFEGKRHKE